MFPIAAFEDGRADGQRVAEIIGGPRGEFDQPPPSSSPKSGDDPSGRVIHIK